MSQSMGGEDRNSLCPHLTWLASAFAFIGRLALSAPVTCPGFSYCRRSHGGHEFIAAGFGHCGGRSDWPPPWHSPWIRGLPHAKLSEDCRWVLALGESALRGSGVRDRGLFPGDLGGTRREPREIAGLGLEKRAGAWAV